ncbi:MAG: methionine--tRNA ligase [Bacteroidia bacterium]|nr:methionine--tRNA ligase [Bacteroidia bacterium]
MEREFKRYMVTSALPYANGPIHIGHLAGVYVPADIYVRYLRSRGREVKWVCGSDEHGVPITIRASQEGVSPQAVVDKYHELIKRSFEEFGMTFDIYHRTSSPLHHATAAEFFTTLYDKGEFVEMESEQYYDEEAEQFLADRYLIGTCPHCGFEKAYGDQCEKCGSSLNGADLINPHSALSGSKPVLRKTKHWYLPLDKYEPFLRRWILDQHQEWKGNVYGQCKSWLDAGLKPRAVTRDLNWGVPVPLEGATGKVLYVWFDAPIGYISATKALTPDWEKYWKDEDTRLVHFIGKDNIVFHCIVFPAMLRAHGGYILPDNVPANEFLNIEGQKVSTSRNWAVWLNEYLKDFPNRQDALRYTLAANMPETKDNDFTWKDFQSRNNSELVAILGNFVNRVMVLTCKHFQGTVPPKGVMTAEDEAVVSSIMAHREGIERAVESFHFRDALKEYMDLARVGNKYLAEMEPWKLVKTDAGRTATVLHVSLQLLSALAGLGEPFLPFTTKKLLAMLRKERIAWDTVGVEMLPEGYQVGEPELLFTKIEDDAIEAQIKKLHENARAASDSAAVEDAAGVAPMKPLIGIEDFDKIDLRVGRILTAEKVEKSNKLLKFTVDTGIDRRTVLSGISKHFSAEQMVGKRVLMVVNLAPRKMMGIESQGMLLFAEGADGRLYGVGPEGDVNAGAQVG